MKLKDFLEDVPSNDLIVESFINYIAMTIIETKINESALSYNINLMENVTKCGNAVKGDDTTKLAQVLAILDKEIKDGVNASTVWRERLQKQNTTIETCVDDIKRNIGSCSTKSDCGEPAAPKELLKTVIDKLANSTELEQDIVKAINALLKKGVDISDKVKKFLKQSVVDVVNKVALTSLQAA